jgi:hypothetical protein
MPASELDIYRPVGEDGELSGLDDRLLTLAAQHLSPEQIAQQINIQGVTPLRVSQRIREILKSQDWLSASQQKSLLLLDLVRLRDILFDRVEGTETKITKHGEVLEVESDSRHASNLIRLLREWRSVIESMQKDIDSEKVTINRAYATVMIEAINVMFQRFILRLEQSGVKLPPERELMDLMEEVMPLGMQTLESKVS